VNHNDASEQTVLLLQPIEQAEAMNEIVPPSLFESSHSQSRLFLATFHKQAGFRGSFYFQRIRNCFVVIPINPIGNPSVLTRIDGAPIDYEVNGQ